MIVSVSDGERIARSFIAKSEFQIGPSNLTPEPIRTPSHASEAARIVNQIAAVRPVGEKRSWSKPLWTTVTRFEGTRKKRVISFAVSWLTATI